MAGPGSKFGLYNTLKTNSSGDVKKVTKNAADLAPGAIVDTTNLTVNLGTLADGDDFLLVYQTLNGNSGTVSAGAESEVSNGTNLSAVVVQMWAIGDGH